MVSHLDPVPDTRAWAETAAVFYRRDRPDAHFRTSSSTSPLFADAVVAVLADHPRIGAVVEVGAGVGTLLGHLHRRRPDLRLTGIDLRARPAELDPAVGWAEDHWSAAGWDGGAAAAVVGALPGPTLLLACEFLDDLPLVAARAGGGRADAWAWWVGALRRTGGLALLVDYVSGPDRRIPLLAYRDGRPVEPVVAPDRNLTAPVDLDAVASAGEAAGAVTLARLRQSDALERWWTAAEPDDPLAALVGRSERHALTAAGGLGDHWWLLQRVDAAG